MRDKEDEKRKSLLSPSQRVARQRRRPEGGQKNNLTAPALLQHDNQHSGSRTHEQHKRTTSCHACMPYTPRARRRLGYALRTPSEELNIPSKTKLPALPCRSVPRLRPPPLSPPGRESRRSPLQSRRLRRRLGRRCRRLRGPLPSGCGSRSGPLGRSGGRGRGRGGFPSGGHRR